MSVRWWLPIVASLGLMAAGCGAETPETGGVPEDVSAAGGIGDLIGSAWRLESLGGVSALEGVEATLEFPETGQVVGHGSCNRFFGTVEAGTDGSIRLSPLGSTRMACLDEGVMAQEDSYLAALEAAERFALDGDALLVYYSGAAEPLRFARMP